MTLVLSVGCTNGNVQTSGSSFFSSPSLPSFDGQIVTSNLGLLWDAAYATGSGFPGYGCAYTSWMDYSGSAHTGTLNNFSGCNGTLGWNGSGGFGDPYRMSFNGGTSNVTGNYVPFTGNADFTIEAWIHTVSSAVRQDILSFGYYNTSGAGVFLFIDNSNFIHIDTVNYTGAISTVTVNDGNWHQVAVTNSGGTYQAYVDDQASGGTAAPYTNVSTGNGTEVGYGINSADPFVGNIAKVAIYTRALSQTEIKQNCTALLHRFSTANCH